MLATHGTVEIMDCFSQNIQQYTMTGTVSGVIRRQLLLLHPMENLIIHYYRMLYVSALLLNTIRDLSLAQADPPMSVKRIFNSFTKQWELPFYGHQHSSQVRSVEFRENTLLF